MAIKGVLFDKDGTLIEVNGTWVPLYRQMLVEDFKRAAGRRGGNAHPRRL